MRNILAFTLFVFIGCKSQQLDSTQVGTDLPAYHISDPAIEKSVFKSMMSSEEYSKDIHLFLNNKEYPIESLHSIMDTIQSGYSINIDTVDNIKNLYIKSR
ncbi:hypothetical protein V6R21_04855 [Limibacter armeniacum]|uniref:hypothetical protein n=1 Tax=Limibacter armeniacum TaxID=466084 RepID=UPI002FE5FAAC